MSENHSNNILPDMEDEVEAKAETSTSSTGRKPLPKSEYWLNLGVIVNGVFASLPYGVAVDNMKTQSIPPPLLEGTDEQKQAREEFRSRRAISNQLVAHLQEVMGKLQPGQDLHLPALTVSIHRVKPKTAEETKTAFSLPTGFSLTSPVSIPVKKEEPKVETKPEIKPETKEEAKVEEPEKKKGKRAA